MEFFPPVVFEIKAKATEAIAEFGAINKQLGMMAKNADVATARLGYMTAGAKYARTALLGMAGAFGVLGVASLEVLDRVEKAQANLEVAVKNTGVSFNVALPYIKQHADQMKNLGFTYEDTYAALAKMTAATGSPQTALNSLAVAADLARAKNMSLAEAGSLIAKASVGAARGLADLGLKIGVTLPKGASLAQILKLIEDRVGGAGEAFGATLGGKIAIAKANFQALEVEIGTKLLPSAIKVTDWIAGTAIPKFEQFTSFLSKHKEAIKQVGMALAGLYVGGKIAAGISVLIKVFEALRAAAIGAAIAEAIAVAIPTGGAGLLPSLATLAALGITTAVVANIIKGKSPGATPDIAGTIPSGAYAGPTAGTYGPTPSLAGKGVSKVTPTPKPSSTPQTVQNITVYASNTNDISKKLSKAAKNGVPIGGK